MRIFLEIGTALPLHVRTAFEALVRSAARANQRAHGRQARPPAQHAVRERGVGTPVLFVHEYAGDYRSWEPQVRHLSRQYRCITFSARGYPPSDVPSYGERYSQDIARDNVTALRA